MKMPFVSPRLVAGLSGLGFLTSVVLQYGLGWAPCHLCLAQRLTLLAILVLSLLWRPMSLLSWMALPLGSLALGGAAVGVYQLSLAQNPQASCISGWGLDVYQWISKIPVAGPWMLESVVSCADAARTVLGVSLTYWSLLLHLTLFLLVVYVGVRSILSARFLSKTRDSVLA